MLAEDWQGIKALAHPLDTHEGLIVQTSDHYTQKILAAAQTGDYREARDFATGWGSVGADLTGLSAMSEAQQGRDMFGDLSGLERARRGFAGAGIFASTVAGMAGPVKEGLNNALTIREAAAAGTEATRQAQVTSWARAGVTPDLNAGRWVQLGKPTLWNYLKTGLWGGKWNFASKFPFITVEGSNVPLSNYITGFIDQSRLMWPRELNVVLDVIKGLLDQRLIK